MAEDQGTGVATGGQGQAPSSPSGPSSTPSSAPSTPSTPPSQSAPGATQASATTPTPGGKPPKPSLMDHVLKAVGGKPTPEPDVLGRPHEGQSGAPTPGPTADDQAGKTQPENKEDDAPTTDDDPLTDFSATGRKKVKKLLRERRELRDEVARLQPDANVGNRLSTFAKDNDLSPDDIVMGMNAMAALRRNEYAAFYRQVAPYVRKAQEVLGLVLPDDLGRRVQAGQMPEAAERE